MGRAPARLRVTRRVMAKPINYKPTPIILRPLGLMGFGKSREERALPLPILRSAPLLPTAHTNVRVAHPACDFVATGLVPSFANFLRLKRNYGAAQSGTVELPCALDIDRRLTGKCNST